MNIPVIHKWLLMAGAALALAGAVPAAARAADVPAATQFGSVELPRLLQGYAKKGAMDQQFQQKQALLSGYFQQQASSPMLGKQDQDRLGALLAQPTRTSAEDAEVTALQQKSTAAVQELAALSQKPAPTPDETQRIAALTKQQESGKQALDDTFKGYQDQMTKDSDKANQQLLQDLKAAIGEVAKQRGLAVVFDSTVAIYTANDITDDVLKRLNK